jgi:RNA polymerase sigma-70 factor, ECF subfamily
MPLSTRNLLVRVQWRAMPHDIPSNNDEALVARCRQDDEEAFRMIFERYANSINGFIYSMHGERDVAEDLTQETFVRAYQKIGTIRDASKLSTWLFGIAKNVAREALSVRISKARTHIDIDASAAVEISDSNPSPSEGLLNKELHQVMLEALNKLDEDKRQVFTLKVFQHLRYDEIAQVTGFSLSKVKSDLHRARGEMQRFISAYTEQYDEV